jgi:hypothetical protein
MKTNVNVKFKNSLIEKELKATSLKDMAVHHKGLNDQFIELYCKSTGFYPY